MLRFSSSRFAGHHVHSLASGARASSRIGRDQLNGVAE